MPEPTAPGGTAHESRLVRALRELLHAQRVHALPDFRFMALQALAARQVAGFGAARLVSADELHRALATAA